MKKNVKKADCNTCNAETPRLKGSALKTLKTKLGTSWSVVKGHHLEKTYKFKNFLEALDFTNRVGEAAEKQGHHPDIYLTWGVVRLQIWTHKIDGLSEGDFQLATKADSVLKAR